MHGVLYENVVISVPLVSPVPRLGHPCQREQEFVAICTHLPTELKDDLKKVATLSEETHHLTAELSRDQAEILEKAKAKYRQVRLTKSATVDRSSFIAFPGG